ncbi:MAG: UDP-2,3-diacylglucosamine diphosphatase, partial [Bacteroidales bacterium]|nr:UDP-2,3-diacylglucosamine diphosphatase [Bacteroidales bacterium]
IGYKIMRWAFHNKVLQRMFSSLHPRWAFAIGTGWSKRSRLAKNEEYIFKGKEEPLYRFCEEYMKKNSVDIFLFGHYHCLTDVPVGNARLLIMKDWMDRDSWIIFDSEDGSIKIH